MKAVAEQGRVATQKFELLARIAEGYGAVVLILAMQLFPLDSYAEVGPGSDPSNNFQKSGGQVHALYLPAIIVPNSAQMAFSVQVGDMNNDGHVDIVTGNYLAPCRVYFNDGSNHPFSSGTPITVGAESLPAYEIAIGDVDGDGDLDIAAANYEAQSCVYLNGGDGQSWTKVNLNASSERSWDVVFADMDNDGDLDAVLANWNQPNQVFFNNGSGTVWTPVNITDDARFTDAITVGDMDGDGDLDVVAGDNVTPCRLYLNQGGALSWIGHDITSDARVTQAIEVADMDGDGDLDVVAGNGYDGAEEQRNRLYLNDGQSPPGWTASDVTLDQRNTANAVLADVNGDGKIDVITADGSSLINSVYLNDGTATPFTQTTGFTLLSGYHANAVAAGDLDNDGDVDIVSVNGNINTGAQPMLVFLNAKNVPEAPIITTYDGVSFFTNQGSITLDGLVDTLTNEVRVNGTTTGVTYVSGSDTWSFASNLSVGENVFEFVAVSSSGTSSSTTSIRITYDQVAPQVVGATAVTSTRVRVDFNESLPDSPALLDTGSYNFAGSGTSLMPVSTRRVNSHQVDIDVNEMTAGASYTVAIVPDTIADTAGNYVDPLINSAAFLGSGNGDSDGDGMDDEWESAHFLSPASPDDAAEDADGDTLSNLREYQIGSDPNNPLSPPATVFVDENGDDYAGLGAVGSPWKTLRYALTRVAEYSAPPFAPVTVGVSAGLFHESITVPANTTVLGAGEDQTVVSYYSSSETDHVVVRGGHESSLERCMVTVPGKYAGAITLVDVDDVAFRVEEALLDGRGNAGCIGARFNGPGSGTSLVRDTVIQFVYDGIHAIDSSVNITRTLFTDIAHDAVVVSQGAKSAKAAFTPLLGDRTALGATGFNRFRNIGGKYLRSAVSQQVQAEFSDWGLNSVSQFEGGLLGLVNNGSYLSTGTAEATLIVDVQSACTQDQVPSSSSPSVTVGSITLTPPLGRDRTSGLFVFPALPPGAYSVTASAAGHTTQDTSVVLDGQHVKVIVFCMASPSCPGAACDIGPDADSDYDGLTDAEELSLGSNPLDDDSDNDGLSDGDEVQLYHTSPTKADSDNDSLSDGDEIFSYGTDPIISDTDGDGVRDGVEISMGTDPLDATDLPALPMSRIAGKCALVLLLAFTGLAVLVRMKSPKQTIP